MGPLTIQDRIERIEYFLGIQGLEPAAEPVQPSIHVIIIAVCTSFGIKEEEIKGRRRIQIILHPRQIAMYLIRTILGTSYSQISRAFGLRNHATALHAKRQVARRMEADKFLRDKIETISEAVQL